mmetsp:Transcript_66548/g.203622  ORF Transcript_66548/g.203622 Transcript_66548/m.203622 type:complete len:345 (+) Transcript_66548:78-1112(+)
MQRDRSCEKSTRRATTPQFGSFCPASRPASSGARARTSGLRHVAKSAWAKMECVTRTVLSLGDSFSWTSTSWIRSCNLLLGSRRLSHHSCAVLPVSTRIRRALSSSAGLSASVLPSSSNALSTISRPLQAARVSRPAIVFRSLSSDLNSSPLLCAAGWCCRASSAVCTARQSGDTRMASAAKKALCAASDPAVCASSRCSPTRSARTASASARDCRTPAADRPWSTLIRNCSKLTWPFCRFLSATFHCDSACRIKNIHFLGDHAEKSRHGHCRNEMHGYAPHGARTSACGPPARRRARSATCESRRGSVYFAPAGACARSRTDTDATPIKSRPRSADAQVTSRS